MFRENVNQPVARDGQEYLHTFSSAVIVPMGQAAVTGLLLGVCTFGLLLIVLGVSWSSTGWNHFLTALGAGLVIALVVTVLMWLALLGYWFWLHFDQGAASASAAPVLKGKAEPPVRKKTFVDTTVKRDGGSVEVLSAEFPIDEHQLAEFCRGLHAGKPLSVRTWTVGRNALMSVDEHKGCIDEMLKWKWIELKNLKYPDRGYILTDIGKLEVEQLAN